MKLSWHESYWKERRTWSSIFCSNEEKYSSTSNFRPTRVAGKIKEIINRNCLPLFSEKRSIINVQDPKYVSDLCIFLTAKVIDMKTTSKVSLQLLFFLLPLTFLCRTSLSCKNQFSDLLCKPIDWYLHDRDLRHELNPTFPCFGGGCKKRYRPMYSWMDQVKFVEGSL